MALQNPQDPLKNLFDVVSSEGLYTKSYEDFTTKYSTDTEIEKLFNVVSGEQLYTKDIKSFKDKYFPVKGGGSEVSTQGSVNTSQTLEQPSSSLAEPSLDYSQWLTQNNITDVDQLGNGVDYDYKAFFDNEGGISLTEGQHLTDAYKKPNHPTFSSGSRYSTEEQKGGDWVQDESGNWTFEASPFNLKQHSTEELINYFSQSDPNANLVLPDGTLAYRGAQPSETVTLDGANAQVNPDGSFVLEVDVEGTDIAGALNPDTNPDFITSVKNTAANVGNRLKGAVPRLNVVSTDLFSAAFGDEIARKIYENDPIRNWFAEPETLEEVRNEAYSTLSALSARQLPTQGIIENIESGNFQNLPAAAVDALGSLVSTAIPSMLTAGAGLYTEMVGESIVDFNTEKAKRLGLSVEELYRQGKAEVGTPVVLGTISGGLEHVGLRGLQANITRKLTGSTARKIATFLGDANKEGVTEFLQTGIEEANRQLGQGQSMTDAGSAAADVMFSKQGLEAYLMGVVASGSAGGIGQLTKNLVTRQAKQNVEQQATTIANLQTSLDNVNISENTKQILQQQIEEAQQNVVNTVLEDFDINSNLTEQQDRQISTLMTELESVQEAINDPNLAEEAKSALRPRAEQLSTQIDEIVNTEQEQTVVGESSTETGALNGNIYTDPQNNQYTISIMDGPRGEVASVDDIQDRERLSLSVKDTEGNPVANVFFWQDEDGRYFSNMTHVNEDYRRRGIATAMYDFARENGYDIKSSAKRTEMGNDFTNTYFNQENEYTPPTDSEEDTVFVGRQGLNAKTVQETPSFTEPEQAEIVNTLTTSGFTEPESTSFIEDITSQEGRQRRLTESAARIRETWSRLRQQGIADNPEQRDQDVARLIRDVTEYAAVAIVDGTLRTARQLANTLGIELDDNVEQAFNRANEIATTYNNSIISSRRQQTRTTINQTTRGGIQGTTTVTNRQALANQIRTLNRGIRMGMQNQRETQRAKDTRLNEVRSNITRMINSFNNTDLFRGATIPANLVPRLVRRLNNARTETALLNFSEYLEKVVDDIEYDSKARQASANSSRLGKIRSLGNMKNQTTLRPLLKQLSDIGKTVTKITDVDEYNRIAELVVDRQGNIGISNIDLETYINQELDNQRIAEQNRKEEAEKEYIQSLMDEFGLDGEVSEYYDAVKAYESSNPLETPTPQREERPNLSDQLKEMITQNRLRLPSSTQGLTRYEANILQALKNTSLDGLDNNELRQLNTSISNAVINGDYITGTLQILERYTASKGVSVWVRTYRDFLPSLRQGSIAKSWYSLSNYLTANKAKQNTNQLIREISSFEKVGNDLHTLIMGDVNKGYSKAKINIDKAVKDVLGVYTANKMTSEDGFKIGAAQYLLNYETNLGWESREQAFEAKKSMLQQSLTALEENTMGANANNIDPVDRDRYKRYYDNTKKALDAANQYDTLEDFQNNYLSEKQRKLYTKIIETWDTQKESAKFHFQRLGVEFTESELYSPTVFTPIETSSLSMGFELGDVDSYTRTGAIDSEGKFIAQRSRTTVLPRRSSASGVETVMFVNLDTINNFNREYSRRTIDIETIASRIRAKYILKSKSLENAVNKQGALSNHRNIVEKVVFNIRDLNGISGFINDMDSTLDSIFSAATTLFYRGAIGSFTQMANQSIPNVPSIWSYSSFSAWKQALKLINFKNLNGSTDIYNLIVAANGSAYTRLSQDFEQKMSNTVQEMNTETDNVVYRKFNQVNNKISQLTFLGVQGGDNFNTTNSWMSGYIESLKEQGVINKYSDFNTEMLQQHIANPNRMAAENGDRVASSVNATVRKASRAESVKSRSRGRQILDSLIGGPLKSFATDQNIEVRYAFRNIMTGEGKASDVKKINAYLLNQFVLGSALRYMWGLGFSWAGAELAGLILGGDDGDEFEKAEERRLKELGLTAQEEKDIKSNRRIISMLAQGTANVLFGSKPIILEQAALAGIDGVYALMVSGQFNKRMDQKEKARQVIPPTLYYTNADNVIGMGVLDGVTQPIKSVTKLVMGEGKPIDEGAAMKLNILRTVTAVTEFGILGADAKRVAQQTMYNVERAVKDGYFKMSNSYGVIKEAVNKYDIKPLAPFNTSKVFMNDTKGRIETFVLSDNEILEINREIGNEMVILLPKYGFGTSLTNFNKSKYTNDIMDSILSKIKTEAKRNVLQRRYKGYYISSAAKYDKQQEQEE